MSFKTVDVAATSVEDAFEQSGLAWIAQESEMLNVANGRMVEDKKVIFRNDNGNQLGVVGKKYGVVQNSDCFSFFDAICEKHNAKIVKVTEYRGGSTVNLKAEIKDRKFDARKGDEVGFRIDLWNSFDGMHKASVTFGALRLVCTNGLVAFDKNNSERIEIRHTMNAVSRLNQAIEVWAGADSWYKMFTDNAKKLAQKLVTKNMVDKFLEDLFGDSDSGVNTRKKEAVEDLFVNGKGNGGGTAWDLLNGATEYVDHFGKNNAEDLAEFSNLGQGYNLKARAFDLALNLAR